MYIYMPILHQNLLSKVSHQFSALRTLYQCTMFVHATYRCFSQLEASTSLGHFPSIFDILEVWFLWYLDITSYIPKNPFLGGETIIFPWYSYLLLDKSHIFHWQIRWHEDVSRPPPCRIRWHPEPEGGVQYTKCGWKQCQKPALYPTLMV